MHHRVKRPTEVVAVGLSFSHGAVIRMGMIKREREQTSFCGEEGGTQPLLLPSSSSQDHDVEGGDRNVPLTPTFLLSIFAVACGSFSTGCTIGYTSPVEYQIIEELGISVGQYTVSGSMLVVGGLVGSLVGGKITEQIGRKRVRILTRNGHKFFWFLVYDKESVTRTVNFVQTILVLDVLFIVGWLTIASAKGPLQLDVGMLLIGIAAPINLYLSPMFVAEITPSNLRGAAVSVTQLIMFCSVAFAFTVGSLISWRALALIGSYKLAKMGKEKEFEAALLQLRGGNADISWEVDEIKVGNGLLMFQQFSGVNAYTMYTGAIFVSAGIPSTAGFLAVASFQHHYEMTYLYVFPTFLVADILGIFCCLEWNSMDDYSRDISSEHQRLCRDYVLSILQYICTHGFILFPNFAPMEPSCHLVDYWMGMFKKQKKEMEETSCCGGEEEGRTQPLLLSPSSSSQDHDGRDVPLTPTFLLSIFAVACGSFSTGCTIGYTSPAEYQIIEELGISAVETMLVLDVLFIVGWLTIASAKGALQLDLGMLLIGIASPINLYLSPIYVAEITPSNLRGAAVSVSQLIMFCCIAFTFVVGSLISWRVLALIGATPSLVQMLLTIFFIPESPRWLAKTGKEKEFEAALQQLRGGNADISSEVNEIKEYMETIHNISKNSSILDMFQKQYAIPLIVGNGLLVLQQVSGMNSYVMYTDAIFVSAGISSTVGFLAVASFQLLGAFLAAVLMDRCGRRPLLLAGVIGTCIGSLLTALSFILQGFEGWSRVTPNLALLSVMIFLGSIAIWNGIPWMIIAEIFPLNIKGSAGTMCCLSYNLSSLMVSSSFQSLLQWSRPGTFFIYAGVSVVAIGFITKLVPETRGKTLEEIQSSFTRK
ncbi:unnamed protein product [Linum tenue]|uniref:Major facilitator superfamily (MFS) profile domain-containing protein n=1 Tax=Linum tenue TaxID=586396 RepID=A0AAV0PGJ5_9ROSI|nr:unnamed protein product [Linum tenue]